jgi:hypothetical protein
MATEHHDERRSKSLAAVLFPNFPRLEPAPKKEERKKTPTRDKAIN